MTHFEAVCRYQLLPGSHLQQKRVQRAKQYPEGAVVWLRKRRANRVSPHKNVLGGHQIRRKTAGEGGGLVCYWPGFGGSGSPQLVDEILEGGLAD